MTDIVVKNENELEITKEVKSTWTREQLESDIVILNQQIIDIQAEIVEKQAMITQLDSF